MKSKKPDKKIYMICRNSEDKSCNFGCFHAKIHELKTEACKRSCFNFDDNFTCRQATIEEVVIARMKGEIVE